MTRKKKIGIITYWESYDNYGQQLQCWALQHYLRLLGYNPYLIRQYVWPPVKKQGVKRLKQLLKGVVANFLYNTELAYSPSIYKYFSFCLNKEACRRQFLKFRMVNLKMSRIYDTPEKLIKNPPHADVYITGSDQVWNYSMPEDSLRNFFLQFGDNNIKRISYAASVGHTDIPKEYKEVIKKYLSKFEAISVREKRMKDEIIKLGYNVEHVLDPTMLLKQEDYMQLLIREEIKDENIYIYSMNYASADDVPFEEIKQYAKENNLPIIVTPGTGYLPAKELFDGVEYSYATISQWIQYIYNSKLVVTASFHGVVFAILFHRSFIYTPLQGEHASGNIRIIDLLEQLGLESRIWTDKSSINDLLSIDWQYVDEQLHKLRCESQNFIISNLKDNV